MELKIIDQSVNCVSKYGVMTSYCSVFLFASQPAELLLCREVGDIVYLSQFVFRLWNGIKLEAKYMGSIDSLYCFDV